MDGIVDSVLEHPLADLTNYGSYRFPDPEKGMGLGGVEWVAFERQVAEQKRGEMTCGDLRHGHTFQQLCDIRSRIETGGCKESGLMLIYGLYPGVPLRNVKALLDAMTKYAGFCRD